MTTSEPWVQVYGDEVIFLLPIPPSTNRRLTISHGPSPKTGKHFLILERAAKAYLEEWGLILGSWAKRKRWVPIDRYWPVLFSFTLHNPSYDSHNGLKLLCDVLQRSGIFQNDLYVMPQVIGVQVNREAPGVSLRLDLNYGMATHI